jgi:hypothetical protein
VGVGSPGQAAARLTHFEGPGVLWANIPGPDLAAAGYREAEYLATGTATAFRATELPADGRFSLQPGGAAGFATRLLIRRPHSAEGFNGTLVVEWLNVSGGHDVAPEYTYLSAELIRRGYAWAGISAQWTGIEGGPAAVAGPDGGSGQTSRGLKTLDPARYRHLSHPGDAYCYDIYTQITRALLGSPMTGHPLQGLAVQKVLAVGESQSAATLSTYLNGIQPPSRLFDGFLIHSRAAGIAPLGQSGRPIDMAQVLRGEPTLIRSDQPVPTVVVQTETDLLGELGYVRARQPDSAWFRLWEVAGSAHGDKAQIGELEALLGCPEPVNRGQQLYVLRAALRHLDAWSRGGEAPPPAPRLGIHNAIAPATFATDPHGNAVGGVRTPSVDAPVAVLSGTARHGVPAICQLFGRTLPFTPARLRQLYPSVDDYLMQYRRAADAAISAGYVLADDRDELLAEAHPDLFTA